MRCRRVRSYLSAYCNDELNGSRKQAISEHLSTCSACRREEAFYRSMVQAKAELNSLKVADDFNHKLLNRIAQERFAETRSKAYLPKRAPVVLWRQVIPAFVTTCMVILLAVINFSPSHHSSPNEFSVALDDSYLTAQPLHNTISSTHLTPDWTLRDQIALAERMNQLSSSIARQEILHSLEHSAGFMMASSRSTPPAPYAPGYYQVRQVIKKFIPPSTQLEKEGGRVY